MSEKPANITEGRVVGTSVQEAGKASGARPVTRELIENRRAEWISHLATEEGATEATCNTYAKEVNRFVGWLEHIASTIERSTLISFRDDLASDYSPATVNLSLVAIRRYLDWLVTEGSILYNPAAGVKGIKDRGRGHTHKRDELTPVEVRRVISVIDTNAARGKRDLAIVTAMAYGALRQIEIQRALIGDYQTERSWQLLWIRERQDLEPDDYIVVNPELKVALADWIAIHPRADDPEAALFCSLHPRTYSKDLTTRHIRRIVKEYLLKAGINNASKTTHSLRNSAITAVIRAGGSLLQVQRVARHINPQTAEKYSYDYDPLEDPAEFMIKY
jgi:site-specific recombinase XerD